MVTLPTEQQWEKAARGTAGPEYPWGEGIKTGDANVFNSQAGEDNLQQTTAVGAYPHRHSPYGVADLAGNVWEWCLNHYDMPEQIKPDLSRSDRVLRGGSWNYSLVLARSAFRFRYNPAYPVNDLGFRVVSSSPFTEH